jgi:hypothetical protein
MTATRKRLQLTPEQGLHRDFLMKRAAYLMRKTRRALAAYKAARTMSTTIAVEDLDEHLTTITKQADEYFKRCAEEREALGKIRAFDALVRGDEVTGAGK